MLSVINKSLNKERETYRVLGSKEINNIYNSQTGGMSVYVF